MRIATWNINGLNARLDYAKIWLAARKPDLVGLQELKMTDDKVPLQAFEDLGYHVVTYGQKAWNGVAVLSREKVEVLQKGLPGQEEMGARLLTVRAGDLVFTTVYCPNGKSIAHEDFPRKLAWFDALARHLPTHHAPERPAVLCGDFNLCPTGQDSYDEGALRGSIFHTDEERARFAALQRLGFIDLFRTKHPDSRAFSWWDYRGLSFPQNQGLRIDLVLGTNPVRDRMSDAVIDRDFRKKQDGLTASDHAPVWVDLA